MAETPSPGGFEVPFQVGISGSEIDFGSSDERERWLRTQSVEVAMVIAARAALRAVPSLSLARGSTGSRLTRRRMILRVFRAVDAAWAVSAFPGRRESDHLEDRRYGVSLTVKAEFRSVGWIFRFLKLSTISIIIGVCCELAGTQ
jgi:hypothetical protein